MSSSFSIRDLAALWTTFLLLTAVLLLPGYVAGAFFNLLEFRRRSFFLQALIAICLSIAFEPLALYLCWRFLPYGAVAEPAAVCAMVPQAIRMSRAGWRSKSAAATVRFPVLIALGWLAIASFCLIDLQVDHRLYVSLVSYDYALRSAFTSAIVRTGVPPSNPYFFAGTGYSLRYHYFWYMVAAFASVVTRGALTPRIAVMAATLWSGLGLIAVVTLSIHLREKEPARLERGLLIGLGLLAVSGLDILPTGAIFVFTHRLNASSEWWNELILSWANSLLWQPHSTAALVACLSGMWLLLDNGMDERAHRIRNGILCGVAVASAIGLSIYVALVFVVLLPAWATVCAVRRWRRPLSSTVAAMIALTVCSLPYGMELLRSSAAHGGPPVALTIRSFYFGEALTAGAAQAHERAIVLLTDLAFLPLNYFLEFGVFLLVGVAQWRILRARRELRENDVFELLLLSTSLFLCTFFRSQTIANNDLGWRTVLPGQWILLLWATRVWDNGLFPGSARWRTVPGVMVILGAMASIYDVAMVRAYPVLLDYTHMPRYGWLSPDNHGGERFYAMRQLYETLDRTLPRDALVQQNPNAVPQDLYFGLYGNRQTAMETSACGVVFGGDASGCPELRTTVLRLFSPPNQIDAHQLDDVCDQLRVSTVVVKDTDPVWKDPNGWVWHRTPAVASAYARAFRCGSHDVAATPK